MKILSPVFVMLLAVASAQGGTLPGFRVETLVTTDGFVSSLVADSRNNLYFTTTDGWIHRVEGSGSVRVVSLPTKAGGNGGLLGMALLDDRTAVVHYTTWEGEKVLDDVISTVDLVTGAEHVLRAFACDVEHRENGASSEHHGGNPTVAADGSIYVGIGEYGGRVAAQRPSWNGGKVWRLDREGNATQYALGLRNPYDLVWDPDLARLVVGDNGPTGGDEVNVIDAGTNCGWPNTWGNQPQSDGSIPPDYVFPQTVAPTGMARLSGANAILRRGLLLGAFVTKAIYYFPDLSVVPIEHPYAIVDGFDEFVIDVTEAPDGNVYFATAAFTPGPETTIQRLVPPALGDCSGDGLLDFRDFVSLQRELEDAPSQPMVRAQTGAHAGSWGCDVTADGLIDSRDLQALVTRLMRKRAARH
jgi:glucose/arabinose dehydrogenase